MGNGQGLPISHTSSSLLHLPHNTSFKLNNILYVPQTSTNLLSVHQLSKDDNRVFSHGFSIQDRATGMTLFHGLSRIGLYPFPSFNKSSSPTALLGVKTTTSIWHQRLGHPALPILLGKVNWASWYCFITFLCSLSTWKKLIVTFCCIRIFFY